MAKRKRSKLDLLLERHRHRCHYCGEKVRRPARQQPGVFSHHPPDQASIDHKTPLSRGGSTLMFNLVLACRRCNVEKGDFNEAEFIAWRRVQYPPA